jgi:hypothetical protein
MHESSANPKIDLMRGVEELGELDNLLQGISRRSAAPIDLRALTQGSQSLALGLVLTAAPQLVGLSRSTKM